MASPDEVQWLILVPNPPPGPTLVQQVSVVLCPVCSYGVFAVVLPLIWKKAHFLYCLAVIIKMNDPKNEKSNSG